MDYQDLSRINKKTIVKVLMMLDGERLNWAEAEVTENRMIYKGDRKENEWDLVADLCEVMKDKKGGGI